MRLYRCEQCGDEAFEPVITLKGYHGKHGAILIPTQLLEYHFCSEKCFNNWMNPGRKDVG